MRHPTGLERFCHTSCQMDQSVQSVMLHAHCRSLSARWSSDYIIQLNRISKFKQPQRSLQVGDIVIIKDSDLFIRSWPLGKVTQTHPGADGLVRVATVKTQKGVYRRAIHKLVPLLEENTLPPGECSGSSPPQDISS